MSNAYDKASLVLLPSAYKYGKVLSLKPASGAGDFSFSRAGTATRVNAAGQIETVAAGVPRLDYTGGSCPAWLMEPARTNLFLHSSPDVNTASHFDAKGFLVAETAAFGFDNAFSLNNATNIAYAYPNLSTVIDGSTEYTLSVYVSTDDGLAPTFGSGTAGNFANDFYLKFGSSPAVNGNPLQYKIVQIGNQNLFKVSSTTTTPASPDNDNYGILKDTSNSSREITVRGFQLEKNDYATSYIPTTGSTATRLLEGGAIGSVDTEGIVNASGGVLVLDLEDFREDVGLCQIGIGVSAFDQIAFRWDEGLNELKLVDASVGYIINGIATNGFTGKLALRWDGATATVFKDGVKLTPVTAQMPSAFNKIIWRGCHARVHKILAYAEALPDADCIAITT